MRLQLSRPTDFISILQNSGTKTTTKLKKNEQTEKQRSQNLGSFHILWIEKWIE